MQYIENVSGRCQGLGNRLFPFARGVIYQHLYGGKILHPSFTHFRTAPFRLGGISYKTSLRKILLFDNFDFSGEKYLSSAESKRIRAQLPTNEGQQSNLYVPDDNCIIRFQDNHIFTDLYDYRELIAAELFDVCKKKWKKLINDITPYAIGLNIRLGNDFRKATTKEDYFTKGAIRTPVNWFVETLLQIREVVGSDLEARIVTDGTAKQLKEVLELPNVTLLHTTLCND